MFSVTQLFCCFFLAILPPLPQRVKAFTLRADDLCDLYDLYDPHDLYDLCDLYDLYDLYDMYYI